MTKVLIVDDLEGVRRMLVYALEDDYNVIQAANGLEAISVAQTEQPDIIVMDLDMPVMDGVEATRTIRGAGYRDVPIVAMTANAFAEDRAQCLAVGMDDFLSKPVEPDRLYSTLLRWLRSRSRDGGTPA